ncbi:MAG: cell division FtsA domain-containing protein [Candidatus Pacebacteria bacterium]|nr:cell division FtsA domain-containing protein [Candidatus Paceibacterota bacterium]
MLKKNPDHNPDIPKRKREEIINARLADIFELVVKRLEAIKRHKILPAGAVVLGGGAHIQNIESFTKDALDLPVRVLTDKHILEMTNRNIKDANMLTAYGLCVLALDEETYTSSYWSSGFFSSLKKFVDNFLEQFSP